LLGEVFKRIDYRYLVWNGDWRGGKEDCGEGRRVKCKKTRFEATTLLKTKEVSLERTQLRTHRRAIMGMNCLQFKAAETPSISLAA